MRRLIGRFRVLLPPSTYVVLYAACYLAATIPLIVAAAGGVGAVAAVKTTIPNPAIAVHVAGMLIYGVYRATAFHPFFRSGYRRWLETTPWSWDKPLPVGPAHPVVEDALIVAAAGFPLWLAGHVHPITSYAIALSVYLVALSVTFAQTGAWGFQFAVPFGLGLAPIFGAGRPELYGAAVLASWLVAMIGLRRSFRRWPWADVPSIAFDPNKGFTFEGKPPALGWPFDRLGPRVEPPASPHDVLGKVLWSLLIGWWFYAIGCISGPEGHVGGFIMVLSLALMQGSGELAATVAGYAPPINLAGRIARLRPLVPSYDQVFLPPFAAIFVALAGPSTLARVGIPINAAIAATASLVMMTLLLGGPDRRTWQLTARHRVVPGINVSGKANEFIRTG